MSSEQKIDELIPAYAIGATDSEESVRLEEYLSESSSAAAELAEFSKMAAAMLFAVPLVEVPSAVESRLFDAINPETATPTVESVAEGTKSTRQFVKKSEPKLHWWEGIFAANRAPQWAFALTALALVLLLNAYWLHKVNQLQQTQLAMVDKLLQQETTLSVIAMDESQRTILPAVDQNMQSKADVIWGEGFEVALLYVEDFPQPDPGKVYQLWLIKDDKRTSGGLFTVNENGTGTLIVQLLQPLDFYDGMGITAEPEGGSEGPTSPPIVRGPIEPASE